MPIWQNEPPAPTDFAGIRIFRVPANGTTVGICCSSAIVGCPTHYAQRRTQPCDGPDCKLCETHGQPRWHGWIAIATLKSHHVAVLELTALAAAPVAEYFKRHGTIRGARIEATRVGNKTNSPVAVKIHPDDVDLRTLPREINMTTFLETLWNPTKKIDPTTADTAHANRLDDAIGNPELPNPHATAATANRNGRRTSQH